MADTPYKSTGAVLYTGGYTYGIDALVNYDSISRTNNTIYVNGANAVLKITGVSGGWFSGWEVKGSYQFPTNSTRRTQSFGTSQRNVGNVLYTAENNFSFGVSSGTTSVSVRAGAAYGGDGISWTSSSTMSVPSLGSPAGTTTVDSSSDTSISVRNNVTTWGSNATAGDVRSYIATDSSFSGQSYKGTTDNALVTHTGLTPNKRYWFRGWSSNGGGKTAYHSSTSGVTRSLVNAVASVDYQATQVVFQNISAVQGEYGTTSYIQYRKKGDSAWTNSESKTGTGFDISISGLLPNTVYERRFVCTTSAGTTTNDTYEFTTLPAGKLVYSDGTVKNGIPRLIHPDGRVVMVQLKKIDGVLYA